MVVCHLKINFANSLDTEQAPFNTTMRLFMRDMFEKFILNINSQTT